MLVFTAVCGPKERLTGNINGLVRFSSNNYSVGAHKLHILDLQGCVEVLQPVAHEAA